MPKSNETSIERSLEKLEITNNDVLLMKGNWDHDNIQHIVGVLNSKGINILCISLPEGMSLEAFPVDDFHKITKNVESKMNEMPDNNENKVKSEQMPEDMPVWADEAIEKSTFFEDAIERVNKLQGLVDWMSKRGYDFTQHKYYSKTMNELRG